MLARRDLNEPDTQYNDSKPLLRSVQDKGRRNNPDHFRTCWDPSHAPSTWSEGSQPLGAFSLQRYHAAHVRYPRKGKQVPEREEQVGPVFGTSEPCGRRISRKFTCSEVAVEEVPIRTSSGIDFPAIF
jgi:hypothetical protein